MPAVLGMPNPGSPLRRAIRPGFGAPSNGRTKRSAPQYAAICHASISGIAAVKCTGFVLADRAKGEGEAEEGEEDDEAGGDGDREGHIARVHL